MAHSFRNTILMTLVMTLVMTLIVTKGVAVGSSTKTDNEMKSCFIREFFGIFAKEKLLWPETTKDVKELKRDVKIIKDHLPITKRGCKYRPAFLAKLSKDTQFKGGQKVKYDTVVTDTCNTYNKSTGIFTCPSSGLYAFHYSSLTDTNSTLRLALHKNDEKVTEAYADDRGTYESLGNSVVLLLQEGDQVYVAMESGYTGVAHASYTTLSGYAL